MSHISHRPIKKKVLNDITSRFTTALAKLDTKAARNFFGTFFTHTERVMFTKRFAILLLLREGWSPYRIARFLNVGQTTVRRVELQFSDREDGAFARTFEKLKRNSPLLQELRALLLEGFSTDPKKRSTWLREFEKRYG